MFVQFLFVMKHEVCCFVLKSSKGEGSNLECVCLGVQWIFVHQDAARLRGKMQPDPCPTARYPGSVFRVRWGTRAESICLAPGRIKKIELLLSEAFFCCHDRRRSVTHTTLGSCQSSLGKGVNLSCKSYLL